MRWGVVAIFLILAASGCLRGAEEPQSPDDREAELIEAATPFLSQAHGGDANSPDHRVASLHAGSFNLERIGYSNGVDESGDADRIPAGTVYTELALHGNMAYIARVTAAATAQDAAEQQSFPEQTGGFVIVDITDPTKPRAAGAYNGPNGFDIEVSSDGAYVFFATQRNTLEELVGNRQTNEDTESLPRGIHIVDVRTPGEPTLATFVPIPYNGPHTIEYYDNGDREFLFVQTYDFLSNTVPSTTLGAAQGALGTIYAGVLPPTQRVMVFELERPTAPGTPPQASPIAQFQLPDAAPAGQLFFPHDVSIQVHPLRAATYMFVAYWDRGVRIVDVSELPNVAAGPDASDLPLLAELGAFNEFSPSSRNNIHLAAAFDDLIDGRHITVAEPEIVNADESGYITFIDTSDPTRPAKACATSYWTLPVHLQTSNFNFSPHNFDTFGTKVALAHNHAGVWVLDASDLCKPRAVGFTMEVVPRADSPALQPQFWGVFEQGGLLYAVDQSSGLYVLRYTGP